MSRLADDVVRRLREGIVAGTYAPGSRLTEAGLSRDFAVSRVPVREALHRLEVEGFLTARAYAGVRVAHLGRDDAADLAAVRTTIETITVERAARRFADAADDPAVRAFGDELATLVDEGGCALDRRRPGDLPPLNTRFHAAIAAFGGSASLVTLFDVVAAKVEWLYAMDVDVRGEHSWAEHREIARAVSEARAADAVVLMREHIARSMEGYLLRHSPGETPVAPVPPGAPVALTGMLEGHQHRDREAPSVDGLRH